MSVVDQQEYLICVLDYFEEYSGLVLVLGYDLRIDAYVEYRLSPLPQHRLFREKNLVKIIRKLIQEEGEIEASRIEYDVFEVRRDELNPIESAHFQKFSYTHQNKVMEVAHQTDKAVILCMGEVQSVKEYDSPIYEKSFELQVKTPHLDDQIVTLITQDSSYQIREKVCFLVKKNKDHFTILGLKPKDSLEPYFDPHYFQQKSHEMKLIEMT